MTTAELQCSMLLLRGYRATALSAAKMPDECRRQHLPAASYDECAAACLAQSHCEAATWFGPASPASVRGTCVGRTAGFPSYLDPDPTADVAYRTCEVRGCGLQARLDAVCVEASRSPGGSQHCRSSTVARNRRVLGGHDHRQDDFDWVCAPDPATDPSLRNASQLLLACVDDRGSMAPCYAPRDEKQPSLCGPGAGGKGHLHDMQRRGCETASSCLATPGAGWPSGPLPPPPPGGLVRRRRRRRRRCRRCHIG